MTPDELEAIRARDADYLRGLRDTGYDFVSHPEGECEADKDRRALLAKVDWLDGEVFAANERVALIREAVVELEGEYAGKILYPTLIRRSKVLDIIEGVTDERGEPPQRPPS